MQIVLLGRRHRQPVPARPVRDRRRADPADPLQRVPRPEPGGQGRGERRRAPEDDGRPGQGPPRRRRGREVPMEELVPGDIVNIEAGDLVPADGRIIRAATLEIDESALTGESAPVPKQLEAVAADAALGDRVDMAFMNTQVTRGAATFVVTSTGMGDRGRPHLAACSQQTTSEETPLTKQLNTLTNQILVIAGVALAISIGLGLCRDQPFQTLFLTAVAFVGLGDPDRPAGRRHDDPRRRHVDAGQGRRHREAAPVGRDAGLDVRDQLRQDRHPHAQPDDRRPDGDRRPPLHDQRRGLLHRGPHHRRGRHAARCRSSATCCRWRCAPTPSPRTAAWSATRPRARSSCSRPRAAWTRCSPASGTRASPRSRSTPRTSSWPRSTR